MYQQDTVTDDFPDAVTLKMVQQAIKQDPIMQKLINCIQKGYITDDHNLREYRHVFQELTHRNEVIIRGDRLLTSIPDAEVTPGTGSLPQQIVDTAHEGHLGIVKCKQVLRAKLWFPHLDTTVWSSDGSTAAWAVKQQPTNQYETHSDQHHCQTGHGNESMCTFRGHCQVANIFW